jgi:hypothetical protein
MDRHGRARWPAPRAALALIAGSALIGLAACGSVTGGGQAAAVAVMPRPDPDGAAHRTGHDRDSVPGRRGHRRTVMGARAAS